jgi:glycosyltransferase involved in cell wall biosynthesis
MECSVPQPNDSNLEANQDRSAQSSPSTVSSIAVYVCTHQRNGPLRRMLDSLAVAAERVQPDVEIAVVVVDDNPDGRAREVVDGFDGPFVRGLHYRHSGAQNISVARNTGLEAAAELADWVAMTDDDQVVVAGWFEAMVAVQARTGADAVTGPVALRYAHGAASWLTDQPFSSFMEAPVQVDGSQVGVCSTGNSMIRSSFLVDHPEIRFRPDLGVVGGEDMVFYRAAVSAGLDARYSTEALCYAEMSADRETYRYQLHSSYWLGNSEYLTNFESGEASRGRLALRGLRRLVEGAVRPAQRVARRQSPQWRFTGALIARSLGVLVGAAGIKVAHP